MKTTLGEDWREFFNIVLTACGKPYFFDQNWVQHFYEVDLNQDNLRGRELREGELLHDGQIYIKGNSRQLDVFFQKITEKEAPKVLFFGDQYISDVHASASHGWDSVAIVEELMHNTPEAEKADLFHYYKYWGDYFQEGTSRNYFLS